MRIVADHQRTAMLLDLSVCIGCRACQVACKEWNELPVELTEQRGSYENPRCLSGDTWKQVKFIERPAQAGVEWLFYSDSCKHCTEAPCLEACPTGAIFRTEDGLVLVNEEVCNGNGHCVPACPFGVIGLRRSQGTAAKCTFCYDRVAEGLETACAQVCPTDCIQYGERSTLIEAAHARLAVLQSRGDREATLYGEHELGGLGVLYLLPRPGEVYGLPARPSGPRRRILGGAWATLAVAAFLAVAYLTFTLGEAAW